MLKVKFSPRNLWNVRDPKPIAFNYRTSLPHSSLRLKWSTLSFPMALVHFTLLFHVLLYCSESLCQCSIKYSFLFRYPKISQDLHRLAFATTALFHSSHVLSGVPVSALCWPSLSQPPRWPDLDVTYQLGLETVLTISVCCVSDQAAASHSSSTCQ